MTSQTCGVRSLVVGSPCLILKKSGAIILTCPTYEVERDASRNLPSTEIGEFAKVAATPRPLPQRARERMGDQGRPYANPPHSPFSKGGSYFSRFRGNLF